MRKLLLVIAVLSTLLPLLEGTPLQHNSGENGGNSMENGMSHVRQVGTQKAEPTKPPCGKNAVACGSERPQPCCKAGQNCDINGVCKCFQTGSKSKCVVMCKSSKNACCVTGVNSNGLCQCCKGHQECNPSKGCQCKTELCNTLCAKEPGSGAIGCCMGTDCKCCKKDQACTITGCTLPCDPTTCAQTCSGKCNTQQICESGCPGQCDMKGHCLTDDEQCQAICRSDGYADGCSEGIFGCSCCREGTADCTSGGFACK